MLHPLLFHPIPLPCDKKLFCDPSGPNFAFFPILPRRSYRCRRRFRDHLAPGVPVAAIDRGFNRVFYWRDMSFSVE
jgi:hypothetical protein